MADQKIPRAFLEAVGAVVAGERKAFAEAIQEMRVEHAKLLVRIMELEAKGRETGDAVVIDATKALARRRAA